MPPPSKPSLDGEGGIVGRKSLQIARPVQRAIYQDEYMEFYDEADALPAGAVRINPSEAPMVVKGDVIHPVKALEEAPDGFRQLDWSGQALKAVPKIPKAFRNARIVKLNDNKITEFPEELASLQLMQRLHIECNSVDQVPSYINTFSLLVELKASENSIAILSGNIGRCEYLVNLELSKNQLSDIPPTLGMCTNLERLWLGYNRLATLPFTLSHLCSLKSLRADRNQIESIGVNLGKLTNLQQLRLGHNRIMHLDQSIGGATALRELLLENNLLQALPPSIGHMKITKLRLDENPLQRPPLEVAIRGAKPVFEFLQRVQYALETWDLDLGSFGLRQVPFPQPGVALKWETDSWVRCKTLSLEHNRLVSLPVEIDLMSNLTILDLQNNFLATIPPTIGKITTLQVLDAAANKVQALPGKLKNNVQLVEILLENNKLTSVPPVVMEMPWIKDLRMTSNRLTTLPDQWWILTSLKHLDLGFNEITSISDHFSGLFSLEVLRMPRNKIAVIPETLVKLRMPSDPPTFDQQASEQEKSQALGGLMNKRVRKQHVRDVLFGGPRAPYREHEQVALTDREYAKPEGAGDRRGWELVRFALFGGDGPRLNVKAPAKVKEEEEAKMSDGSSDEEEEEIVVKPQKKPGFVGKLRGMLMRKSKGPALDEAPGGGVGVSEKSQAAEDAKAAQEANTVTMAAETDAKDGAEAQPSAAPAAEQKQGMFASFRKGLNSVMKKASKAVAEVTANAQDDFEDDDYGAYLKEIKEIDLSFNRIERIPNGIGNLSTLTCLKLQNNRIEKIPHYIGRLHVLKHLNLSHNLILEVPPDFKRLQKLETLDLSMQLPGDLLGELPWEMRFLTQLKELRLSGNNFRHLPQCIFPAPSTDDDAGPGMTSLRILAIDHNPLLGIDEDMACCPLLEKLLVHNTKIRRLHKSIVYNRCLEEIWISDTAIRKLDTEVATLRQLKKIVLNHEDQLEGFTEIRRSIRGSVWCFLSEGEGMMAELSAVAKLEERIQRGGGKYKGKSLAAAIRTEAFGGKEVQELSMKDYQKSVLEKSRKAAAAKEDGDSQESSPADSPRGGPIIKFSKDTKGGESSDGGEAHAEESPDDGPITDGE